MAKDRVEVCKSYVCVGAECKKGRKAEHKGYCQVCDKYKPRVRKKHPNQKKLKLQKIRAKEVE